MGKEPDQIKQDIEMERGELGRNLQELETKVKSVTDWRAQFEKNPMTMMAVAFGGGVLLSAMLGGSSRPRYRREYGRSIEPRALESSPAVEFQNNKVADTIDNIKGAIIGVAATKFQSFLGELIPGFHEQYRKTEQGKTSLAS